MKYKAVKTTLQMQAADCGAASLKMLLDSYGHHYTLEHVRQTIGVGRDGSSVRDIMNGAERFGFLLEPIRGELPQDLPPKLPAILWWNRNHFLIYEGIQRGKHVLNDPAMGRRTLDREEFLQGFSGITLIMSEDLKEGIPQPDDHEISNIEMVFANLNSVLPATVVAIVIALAISIPTIFSAQLTSYFVDNILVRGEAKQAIQFLWIFFALAGINTLLTTTTYQIANRAAYIGTLVKGYVILRGLIQSGYSWVTSRQIEELSVRPRLAAKLAVNITYQSVTQLAKLGTALIISFVIFAINPWLGLIGITLLVALGLLTAWIDNISASENCTMAIEDGKQQGIALSSLISLQEIRIASLEGLRFSQWAGYYTNFVNSQQSVSRKQNISGLASNAGFYLANTSLIVIGPILIILKQISLGDFVAVQYLLGIVTIGIVELPGILKTYQDTISPVDRLRDLFESNSNDENSRSDSRNIKGSSILIKADSMAFAYDARHPIFNNLTVQHTLTPFTYIDAPPGSGKSTFLQIAAGLLNPNKGAIIFETSEDSVNSGSVSITYLPANPLLISGSILDNITLMDPRISRSRAINCLKLLCRAADSDMHYNYQVASGGKNLSTSAKQVLLLARLMASVDRILIIDSLSLSIPNACLAQFTNSIVSENRFVISSSILDGVNKSLVSSFTITEKH